MERAYTCAVLHETEEMRKCPQCGRPLSEVRSRFCDFCGYSLSGGVEADRQGDESGAPPLSALSGRATQGPGYSPQQTRRNADGEASGIAQTVTPDVHQTRDENSEDSPSGLRLCANTNQFYMEGLTGILDIKVMNSGPGTFNSITIEVSGDLLGRAERWCCALGARAEVRKKFAVKPKDAGVGMVRLRIDARQGDVVHAYWAETEFPVFERASQLNDIRIQADRFINVGGATGGSKDMAHAVNVNIENLVKQEKIQDANGLMREYQKLPPEFRELHLEPQSSPAGRSCRHLFVKQDRVPASWSWRRQACIAAGIGIVVLLSIFVARHTASRDTSLRRDSPQAVPPGDVNPLSVQKPHGGEQADSRSSQAPDETMPAEHAQESKADGSSSQFAGTGVQASQGKETPGGTTVASPGGNSPPPTDPELERAIREATVWMNQGFLDKSRERIASALQSYPNDARLVSLEAEVNRRLKQKQEEEARRARSNDYQ